MDMSQKTIKHLFTQRNKMYIPTYQRRYSWKRENVERFLDDIEKVIENIDDPDYTHYIGTVYIQEKQRGVWELIDGQQRITTISLIAHSIISNISSRDVEQAFNKKTWEHEYLIDRDSGEIKVELSYDDEIEYNDIRTKGDTKGEGTIKTNYRLINKWVQDEFIEKERDLEVIIKALDRLRIIEVALSEKDNAQEVFDGINATGQPLTTGEQMKNFLLMPFDKNEQERLYLEFWRPIEIELGTANNFHKYLTIYLTVKNETQLNTTSSLTKYATFKFFKDKFGLGNREFLESFKYYFDVYMSIQENRFNNRDIKITMNRILYAVKTDGDALGYLIQLVEYYNTGNIDDGEFLRVLRLHEGYILRRILTDGYGGSKSFYNFIHKASREYKETNRATYEEGVKYTLNRGMDSRTPLNTEVELKVQTTGIGKSKTYLAKYVLERIENGHSKEQMDVYEDTSTYTVEHIMPQTLTDEWERQLGVSQTEQAPTYLHTLGNLTLTGYNSEYSNKSFEEKLNVENGFRDSRFTNLNRYLVNKTNWDINMIKDRSVELARRLNELYPYE